MMETQTEIPTLMLLGKVLVDHTIKIGLRQQQQINTKRRRPSPEVERLGVDRIREASFSLSGDKHMSID